MRSMGLFVRTACRSARLKSGRSPLSHLLVLFAVAGLLLGSAPAAQAGTWRITVSYAGSANGVATAINSTPPGASSIVKSSETGTGLNVPAVLGDLSGADSFNGRVLGELIAIVDGGTDAINVSNSSSYATIVVQVTWQPNQFLPYPDTPPAYVDVYYQRRVAVAAEVHVQGGDPGTEGAWARSQVSANHGALPVSIDPIEVRIPPGREDTRRRDASNGDPTWVRERLPVSQSSYRAIKEFSVGWSMHGEGDVTNTLYASAGALAHFWVDFSVNGAVPSRAGGQYGAQGGQAGAAGSDPSFTRWLPLTFSPVVSSQPFRRFEGALPGPWGNLACAYSIALRHEENHDQNGALLSYPNPTLGLPLIASGNTRGTPPGYVITDATGERLTWTQSLARAPEVRSDLVAVAGGYELRNAGPPGALKQRGRYTYVFGAPPAGSDPSLAGRLVAIRDNLGNQHTLVWQNANPFLIVTDSSSGRQLRFTWTDVGGSYAYVGNVEALVPGTSVAAVRTQVVMNAAGQMMGLKVFEAGASTPVRDDVFTYTGDAISRVQQGGSLVLHTYLLDQVRDPLGYAFPRLASSSFGDLNDVTSSDDGQSVQGMVSYSYGYLNLGYGYWGLDANTDTITDARSNVWTRRYWLSTPTDLSQTGALRREVMTGPTFTGATGANEWDTQYTPDIAAPTLVNLLDPLGRRWQANLDTFGNLLGGSVTGNTTGTTTTVNGPSFEYSTDGKDLLSATDATGVKATFTPSTTTPGRLGSVTDQAGVVRLSAQYNSFGQPLSVTSPVANGQGTTTFAYDNVTGDLTRIAGPDGSVAITGQFNPATGQITGGYDALGDPLSFSVFPDTGDPATSQTPLTTSVVYDAAQMPVRITGPAGTSQVTNLANGSLTGFEIQRQGATLAQLNFTRDSRGRAYRTSDVLGTLTQYRYDKNSNLTQLWDGRDNVTKFTYGSNNELTGVTHGATNSPYGGYGGNGGSDSFQYDAAGRVRQATDERGIVKNYGYDDADRLKSIELPATPGRNLTYQYDAAGRVQSVSDASGNGVTFAYNHPNKRLTGVTSTQNGRTYTVSYNYYPDGRRASMVSPLGTSTYAYDSAGRVSTLTTPLGETTTWGYDRAGRLLSQSTMTGAGVTLANDFLYGPSGQSNDLSTAPAHLRRITQSVNNQPRYIYNLVHSHLGQLLSLGGSGSAGESESAAYGYDGRGRLDSESVQYQGGGQNVGRSGAYDYDLSGNLLGGASGWVYNTKNQVTSAPAAIAPATSTLAGASGLTYDNAGNLTGGGDLTLAWDPWGNLETALGTLAGTVTYTYDVLGRRATRAAGGQTTFYLYDGAALIAETDANGTVLRSYTWGAMGLISDRANSQSRFYWFDHGSNTRALLDANGNIVSRGAYTAWGAPLSAGLTPNTPFGWKGRMGAYQDTETGLVRMGARYYAKSLGRFVSRDPSGFGAGPNLYAYCWDDPVNFFDPDGLSPYSDYETWVANNMGWYADALNGFADWAQQPPSTADRVLEVLSPERAGARMVLNTAGSLIDSWRNWGDQEGRNDAGKADPWALWGARGRAAYETGAAAFAIYGGGNAAMGAMRAGAGAGAAGAGGAGGVGTGGGGELVGYNGRFAAEQILGHPPFTPGRRVITRHAAERMVSPPYGRASMTAAEVDQVLNEGTRITKVDFSHAKGTTVTIQHPGMPGRPRVTVDAATGRVIITVIKGR